MRFDSYHPAINLIYFLSVFTLTIVFNHPVFVLLGYLSAFSYSVKLNGIKQLIFNIVLIPAIFAYTAWYSYYNHFGVTVLTTNFIDNSITLESVLYGLCLSVTVATVLMLLSCLFTIFTTDKIVYLFGKVSPRLSLFISILLRTVPRVKKQVKRINVGQKCIGRGLGGRFGHRGVIGSVIDFFRIVSITITWTLESFVESAASMKCRGYSLRGRTAFSIYRFDNRDRGFVISIFLLLTTILIAYLLDQTNIHYDPEIVMNRITPVSFIFYIAYAGLFILPMILQIITEKRFEKLKDNREGTENI